LRYRNTWHNLGFMLLDNIAAKAGASFKTGRGQYFECRVNLDGSDLLLIKPSTYMNLSGQALQACANFYKIEASDILVCFDDLDLPLGQTRFKPGGSGGNHNGMSHIVQLMGSNIPRLRMGFHPPVELSSASWKNLVLSPIPGSANEAVTFMLNRAEDGVKLYLKEGIREAMNQFNRSEEKKNKQQPEN
jgi:peptidyl-tRNA hydrolase, PTH1 family